VIQTPLHLQWGTYHSFFERWTTSGRTIVHLDHDALKGGGDAGSLSAKALYPKEQGPLHEYRMHPGEMAPIEEAYFIRVWYVVGIKAATSAIVQFHIHSLCFSTLLILLAFSYASSRY
jgi:hypothetical protein